MLESSCELCSQCKPFACRSKSFPWTLVSLQYKVFLAQSLSASSFLYCMLFQLLASLYVVRSSCRMLDFMWYVLPVTSSFADGISSRIISFCCPISSLSKSRVSGRVLNMLTCKSLLVILLFCVIKLFCWMCLSYSVVSLLEYQPSCIYWSIQAWI